MKAKYKANALQKEFLKSKIKLLCSVKIIKLLLKFSLLKICDRYVKDMCSKFLSIKVV